MADGMDAARRAPLEDEAFSLLERLSDVDEAADQLRSQVSALYRLTDAMVQARHRLVMAPLEQDEQHTKLHSREQRKIAAEQLLLGLLPTGDVARVAL